MPRKYTKEEKTHILALVAEIGAVAAAKETGASYQIVLKWMKENTTSFDGSVKDGVSKFATFPAEVVEKLNAEIENKEEEIKGLEETLKMRKAELRELQKAKVKAEKEKELFEAAEEKKKIVEAVMKSGRSAEEIMEFLKK